MIITTNSLTCRKVSIFLILLTIHVEAYSSFVNNGSVKCRKRERLALLKFKAELIDPYGQLSTWRNDGGDRKDCCKWEGVLCDNQTNHVVELDLYGMDLEGKISPSLLELTNLNYLNLRYNYFFQAQIPEFIGSLGKLQYLNLGVSGFGGLIPHSLGNLSSLRFLNLSRNYVLNKNLDWLSGLQSLEYLDLSFADLQNATTWPQSCGLSINMLNPLVLANASASLVLLDLSNNYLDRIPHAIGDLISRSHLDLSHNQLQAEFPQCSNQLNESLVQGNLRRPNLKHLDMSNNKFSGQVPNLSSCLSLTYLSLSNNMFNGTLTESIGYLSNVEHLDLCSNHLEGQVSEAHLLNLSKLRELDLSFNSNLTIKISSLWNPSFQLSSLMLRHCKLGPHYPKWLRNQKQLEVVDISNAKISDSIPHWFWDNIQMIMELNMSHNQIHGVLPDLSSNIHLLTMDLSSNEFSGSLPLPPQNVTNVYLSRNKFSGTITNFCNFTFRSLGSSFNLYFPPTLDLSHNLFSTEISQDCFTHLMHLTHLNLANNNFSGKIPNSVDLCQLSLLHLRNNSFTGKFSRSLKNCSDLIILDLGENKFTGTIPSWLGETKLQVLDISENKIWGTIPECVKNFTMLSLNFTPIPNLGSWIYYLLPRNFPRFHAFQAMYALKRASDAELFVPKLESAQVMWKRKMTNYPYAVELLTLIDLSENSLTGEIPVEITSLVGLFGLNLSRNNLVGSIPHDIGRLEVLNFLDLSKNNLSGSNPPTLSQLSHLGILDLSFNNLSGRIPWDTHMQTFDASAYMGNPGLCGLPLVLKPCPEMPKKPRSANNVDEVHENKFITGGFYISSTRFHCCILGSLWDFASQ
ncbi:Leucine-rich repeat protein [Handroanthus impetiginosus]|uniref:Leucine-rich repeat protein n=1 Tax=Handroanthus impetiginosus TaxID=429701 RepID=A0A2G9GYA9_9LAMI|nr:Leucine-rich repeat protein [Handroanthus impetiginosus]